MVPRIPPAPRRGGTPCGSLGIQVLVAVVDGGQVNVSVVAVDLSVATVQTSTSKMNPSV